MICIHWTLTHTNGDLAATQHTAVPRGIYISLSLLITLTLWLNFGDAAEKANIKPFVSKATFSHFLFAWGLQTLFPVPLNLQTFTTNSVSLPSLSASPRPLSHSCQSLFLSPGQHSLNFQWSSILVSLRHRQPAQQHRPSHPHPSADGDCFHQLLPQDSDHKDLCQEVTTPFLLSHALQ